MRLVGAGAHGLRHRNRTAALILACVAFLLPSPAEADSLIGAEAMRHRDLLRQAERDLSRGALEDGLAAVDEAFGLANAAEDRLRMAAAQVVRATLLIELGRAEKSLADLEAAIAVATTLNLRELAWSARINLANAQVALGESASAVKIYSEVIEEATDSLEAGDRWKSAPSFAARAHVNRLRAHLDAGERPATQERAQTRDAVEALPDSFEKAMFLTHLGESLLRAIEADSTRDASLVREGHSALSRALELLERVEEEESVPRIRAQALGDLGAVYAAQGRLIEALMLTRRAILQATQTEIATDLFVWHRQSAALHERLGHRDAAIADYAVTLEIVEDHRTSLSRRRMRSVGSPSAAADFSDIYRRYVDLLLRRARDDVDPESRRTDLLTAQSALERLKSDELRDYFQDDCVIRYQEKLASIAAVSYDALIVYPFLLEDRLELLVSVGDELFQVKVDVSLGELTREVESFRRLLEKRTTRQYLRPARQLHSWLIEPIEEIIARFEPKTLVFVPDGILRTIPMAALHDGERFLVERIALGLTPGLELTDPRPYGDRERRALVAGVSESIMGFSALPNVEREINMVHEMLGGDKLINQSFSRKELTDRIREKNFGLIHIASHAQFTSTASGGFLLAHDGRLGFNTLADAVDDSKYKDDPLELIVLSACDTAQGDAQSALGLSGVAIKAGARSALGTLWRVSDEATTEFMIRFYGSLQRPGVSRADAVRSAQTWLIGNPTYQHPYYWSPFLLINSWL